MDQNQNLLELTVTNPPSNITIIDSQNALSFKLATSDISQALDLAKSAENLSLLEGYTVGLANALKNQCISYHYLGDNSNALTTANEALKHFEALQDTKNQAYMLRKLGFLYAELGDYARALELELRVLSIFEAANDVSGQAKALTDVGVIHSMAGDPEQAVTFYQRSIELFASPENKFHRAIAFNSCCVDYKSLGNYAQARSYGEQALELFLQINDVFGAGVAHSSLGEVALANHELGLAIEHFDQALTLLIAPQSDQIPAEVIETRLNLGQAYYLRGDTEKALEQMQRVLSHVEKQNMQHFSMRCHHLLSQIYEQTGNLPLALNHLKQYVVIHEQILSETSRKNLQHLQILHETQRAQAESERQKKLREQDRQNFERITQLKDEFLHNATHDIKNPLTVINSSIFLMRAKVPPENQKFHDYINRMERAAEKIRHLVEDILDLAKLEATPLISTESIALNQWFDTLLKEFKGLAEAKQISLTSDVQPPDLVCKANKQRLGTALENLLSNAFKYTPDGGVVQLSAAIVDSHIQIQIIDNGIGIPEDAVPNLFNRFYRVNTQDNKVEGTGLGLNIVKTSVEQHGGKISVKSNLGNGTTFTILLPV